MRAEKPVIGAALAGLLTLAACGSSHGGDEDAGAIMFDARLPDSGPTDLCGNRTLDPGERCDDGNTTAGDGCNANCEREAFCGDNMMAAGEVCDDGNNRSGDGCRSDCLSNETCGNDIVDPQAGEICDGTPGCMDCRTLTGCGDGTRADPETCDDGNTSPWDECTNACRAQIALVINSLALAARGEGCDLNGDNRPDNQFAIALGFLSAAFGPLIEQAIRSGQLTLLLSFLGLDDPNAINDPDFRIAWMTGADADANPENNFTGSGTFYVQPDALTETGAPATSIQSAVSAGMLRGGPEDIPLPLGFFPVDLKQGRVQGMTQAAAGRLEGIQRGQLCGGIQTSLLSLLGGFLGGGGGGGPSLMTGPACGGGDNPTLLDLIIAGGMGTVSFGTMQFPLNFQATRPDLDLDGDGLEAFEVETEGEAGCQPVVVACIDGDGRRIEGRDCAANPQIGDGYSAAFNFGAVRAVLRGLAPENPTPPPDGGGTPTPGG